MSHKRSCCIAGASQDFNLAKQKFAKKKDLEKDATNIKLLH